ncbi:hypothetical protein TAMA11512_21310 [Selenomonas sp. TAMA-11512]|uniref:hypothetical protein n=1 Tax=Selenomonas sp. TAMA-11512 TaxID=3095337 RepID=UPI00308EC029|nr:hypothetical protein TAMA11512_21310 [Selenomonas sp. TAMA-11512]
MATRNYVPRAMDEGTIGTKKKKWKAGYFGEVHAENTYTKTEVDELNTAQTNALNESINELKEDAKDVVGVMLAKEGLKSGIWLHINKAGRMIPRPNFDELYPWNAIEAVTFDGQAMVKIPKFYHKYENKCRWISKEPREGYHLHPAFIRNGEEKSCFYIGAYEAYNADSAAGSAAGKTPWVSVGGLASAINSCTARNTNANDPNKRGWHLQTIYERAAISLLMLIEYATTDMQAEIGNGSQSTIVATGTSNAKWRGLSEWWGNVWEHTDGFKTDAEGKAQIFSNACDGTYVQTNVTVAAGWITDVSVAKGEAYDLADVFIPVTADAVEVNATYADYAWAAANSVLHQSDCFGHGTYCGPFSFAVNYAATVSLTYLGLRLAKYADN